MREIKLAFAGKIFGIKFAPNRPFSAYLQKHAAFLTDGKPDFSLTFYQRNGMKNLFSVSVKKKGESKIIRIENKTSLERSFATQRLGVSMDQALGLENYLRVFFSQYLFTQDGFLLHASTIGYKNRAYVFTGPSGVGKSTIARISRDKLVLTDDTVAIRRMNNRYYAFATPFGVQSVGAGGIRLPIAAIFLISHAEKTTCTRIPPLPALTKIISNIILMGAEAQDLPIDKLFDTCYNLVKETPCYALPFNKNEDIWRVLSNAG
jgi:hypothetical protein